MSVEEHNSAEISSINPRDRIISLERGLAVLAAVGRGPGMTLAEIAAEAGVSRAAARRILITLAGLDYIEQRGNGYVVRPRVFEFGYAYLSEQPLTAVAATHLEALAQSLGEFCSIAVPVGVEIVHIMREAPQRFMRPDIPIGSRFPAHATAQGRMLLAALSPEALESALEKLQITPFTSHTARSRAELIASIEQARQLGYALNDRELDPSVRSAAVAILDRDGHALAALGTIVNASEVSMAQLRKRAIGELRATAERISADLRAAPVSAPQAYRRPASS
ncbi:MAG TPA: IclR family transcriptional regulator C-terminal domain-containing protein [Solirubrobacter sp.]|nr:IclR family transcriptional regulator C-terminal domain-containing protein [Solirubrobacter sp.]